MPSSMQARCASALLYVSFLRHCDLRLAAYMPMSDVHLLPKIDFCPPTAGTLDKDGFVRFSFQRRFPGCRMFIVAPNANSLESPRWRHFTAHLALEKRRPAKDPSRNL